jgi:thioesterase domain-containing protein
LLVLFSAGCPTVCEPWNRTRAALYQSVRRVVRHGSALLKRAPREWGQYLHERAAERRADQEQLHENPLRIPLVKAMNEAFKAYRPQPGKFPVYMMLPDDQPELMMLARPLDWGLFAKDFTVVSGPPNCDMHMVMVEPHVAKFAQALDVKFREAALSQSCGR